MSWSQEEPGSEVLIENIKIIWRSKTVEGCMSCCSGIPRLYQIGAPVIFLLPSDDFLTFVVLLSAPPGRLTAPWVCSGPARCAPTWVCSSLGSWPVSLVLRSFLPSPWRRGFNQVNICAAVSHQCHSCGPANGTDTGRRAAVMAHRTKHGDRLKASVVTELRLHVSPDLNHWWAMFCFQCAVMYTLRPEEEI